METVLVVGSTGNIGIAAIIAALRTNRKVLAVVRNADSAKKLDNLGPGITTVEADITSDSGVRSVVEKVRKGELPAFQHVFSCGAPEYLPVPLKEITTERLRRNMTAGFETNFFAYKETIDYLIEQNNPASTWTGITGAQGYTAVYPLPAVTQGALFSMYTAMSRETEETNVRFNEIYLVFRVEKDEDAIRHGVTKASEFAVVYEQLLADTKIKGCKVNVEVPEDMKKLKYERKF